MNKKTGHFICRGALTCPLKTNPDAMLDERVRKGGENGQETVYGRADHQQAQGGRNSSEPGVYCRCSQQ